MPVTRDRDVERVDLPRIETALTLLANIDPDAADRIRAHVQAYCLFLKEPLEIREILLDAEHRCRTLAYRAHELAIEFERFALGEFCDED